MTELWEKFAADVKPYTTYVSTCQLDYGINISLKYKYIYVETPKAGCSTIKLILQRMELDDPEYHGDDLMDIHTRIFTPMIKPSQVGSFHRYQNRADIKKFCFVRNPFTRLLSSYLEKIQQNKSIKSEILSLLGMNPGDLSQAVSFHEFVSAISLQSISSMNPHWRPQFYQTYQESIEYDYIGRFESLENDLAEILAKIQPDYQKYWGSERRHASNANQFISEYYSPTIIDQVIEIYAKDFTYFGYPKKMPIDK